MEAFLKSVEKKAFRIIQIATGDTDEPGYTPGKYDGICRQLFQKR
jgi:hypothetical protein